VAANAFAARLKAQPGVRHLGLVMKTGVALETKLAPLAPNQQEIVGASVRVVACDAALDFDRRVLVNERAALFYVAIDARFETRLFQACRVQRAVRVVAIRALHQAFGNPMVLGKRELGLNGLVTGEAGFRLRLLEQAIVQPASFVRQFGDVEEVVLCVAQIAFALVLDLIHKMRRVALIAGDAMPGVRGLGKEVLLLAARVAGKAARDILFGGPAKHKERIFLERRGRFRIVSMSRLDRIRVSLSGTMARFTALDVLLAGERELGVGGLLKLYDFRFVARAATIGACEFRWRGVELRRPGCYRGALLGVRHFLREADAPDERETAAEH